MSDNTELVEAGDVDGLLRRIDDLVDAAGWEDLAGLCRSCRAAVERGKQLWPVALHGEYRLALSAPVAWAAPAVVDSHGRFGFGPLTEVVAANHTWEELRDHLPNGPDRSLTAHERVVRGEAVDPDEIDSAVLGIPTRLLSWEPAYPAADYEPHKATFPAPAIPELTSGLGGSAQTPLLDDTVEALLTLTAHWAADSTGRTEAVMVEGTAGDAVATLGLQEVRAVEVEPTTALAVMSWAAASGAAHGRRRGMATGRFESWWTLASLVGLDDTWPPGGDELGELAEELNFYAWHPPLPESGWALHLAVEDPVDRVAWAISAVDAG